MATDRQHVLELSLWSGAGAAGSTASPVTVGELIASRLTPNTIEWRCEVCTVADRRVVNQYDAQYALQAANGGPGFRAGTVEPKPPQVLFAHFNRVCEQPGDWAGAKSTCEVVLTPTLTLPFSDADGTIAAVEYELVWLLVHTSTITYGGHYVLLIYVPGHGWWSIDDLYRRSEPRHWPSLEAATFAGEHPRAPRLPVSRLVDGGSSFNDGATR